MQLDHYFKSKNINKTAFAKKNGIQFYHIANITRGYSPSLLVAMLIENGTKGKVTAYECLGDVDTKKLLTITEKKK